MRFLPTILLFTIVTIQVTGVPTALEKIATFRKTLASICKGNAAATCMEPVLHKQFTLVVGGFVIRRADCLELLKAHKYTETSTAGVTAGSVKVVGNTIEFSVISADKKSNTKFVLIDDASVPGKIAIFKLEYMSK